MSDFPMLHSKQAVTRLSNSSFPPLAAASRWSINRLAPSCGVRPQYWQVKLSLLKISNLIFNVGLLVGLLLRPLPFLLYSTRGIPAASKALAQDPKRISYIRVLGKAMLYCISRCVGARPRNRNASLSLLIKNSFDNLSFMRGLPIFLIGILYYFVSIYANA